MASDTRNNLYIKAITWSLRILCGGLFIFSGFVKAIDPWGTIFKIEDYFGALNIDFTFALIRIGVFFLCALEFVVGFFLLTGCFRKSCPPVAFLIMCFMLPLTFWIAVMNPISDCGCFGDAWHLSNWATFIKNCILMGGIIWLVRYNLSGICLIAPAFQWLAVVASGVFILFIELIGFYEQPLLDFRDYPVGATLFASESDNDSEPEYLFRYEKNGEIKEFTINDEMPDEESEWKFIGREETGPVNQETENGRGLRVFDRETMDEANDEALDSEGDELVVMIPKASMVSPATTWKLNLLYDWAMENGVKMVGIVSGSPEEITNWEDLSMASYPIFVADDTSIKAAVRGNPGIIFLHDGTIEWKTNISSFNVDDFTSEKNEDVVSSIKGNNGRYLLKIVIVYLIFMLFLVFISFTPRMARLLTAGGLASKRGVRHH